MKTNNFLRLIVWNNWRETRFDHGNLLGKGAVFVSRCQVYGFKMVKMFGTPVILPTGKKENKLDAELYAVTANCLWWTDEQLPTGFDRVNVVAHMFAKSEPFSPHLPKNITGMQVAWIHFFTKPEPQHSVVLGSIFDFPNTPPPGQFEYMAGCG